jgi:ferredoxin
MKTTIYYFSGTGNSLVLARSLAKELGEAEVISIPKALERGGIIENNADCVGIVYPVYALGVPLIVERFISMLKLKEQSYLFVIANYALCQGAGITRAIRAFKRKGMNPQAGFGMIMPGNYTPFYGAIPKEKQKLVFEKTNKRIVEVANMIKQRKPMRPETGFFLVRWLLWEPIAFLSAKMMQKEDKHFWVNEKCDSCGICKKICPVKNIDMINGKPIWNGKCEQCFACFHWCPTEAIQFGKRTLNRKRYRHPDVLLKDML